MQVCGTSREKLRLCTQESDSRAFCFQQLRKSLTKWRVHAWIVGNESGDTIVIKRSDFLETHLSGSRMHTSRAIPANRLRFHAATNLSSETQQGIA